MNARDRNRAKFSAGAELKDLFAAQGMDGAIVYAENAAGETIGKRDEGQFVDGIAMAHHAAELAHWFGKASMKPDAAPKRRAMTDAQRARLRGDV